MRSLASFLGNLVLVSVLGASLVGFGIFFDALGIISVPDEVWRVPLSLLTPRPATVTVVARERGTPAWTNLLGTRAPDGAQTAAPEVFFELPETTPTPEPTAVPTPVPPLSAPEYRDAVMVSLKSFSQAVGNWLDASDMLIDDPALAGDPGWQNKTGLLLEQVVSAAQVVDQVGPAPAEYAGVDARLKQILPEALALQANYGAAMRSADTAAFEAAGQNFANIKDILTLAVGEMQAAGWPSEE